MQLVCFSWRFIQIKDLNQKFQQMTFIRIKIGHFRTEKNLMIIQNGLRKETLYVYQYE